MSTATKRLKVESNYNWLLIYDVDPVQDGCNTSTNKQDFRQIYHQIVHNLIFKSSPKKLKLHNFNTLY